MERVGESAQDLAEGMAREDSEQFRIDARDFLSARERGGTTGTRIDQQTAALSDAAEIVNRSFPTLEPSGRFINAISPVVIPNRQSLFWRLMPIGMMVVFFFLGALVTLGIVSLAGSGVVLALFGPHLWVLLILLAFFSWWRQSVVAVPDGSMAVITRFGKLEEVVGPGRKLLFNPWKQVSYIVNTTREYPYNAPIRQAPTASRVNASVDLFLQFRIEDPAEFIFTVGGVKGFSDKLENAISEVTRALIYEQRAEDIYDLVGESTQKFLDSLNEQFLPAVRFTNANITHAEPSSQEYRMDLAAPEMVRVAKEAYTYEYELRLRKEQDEGELRGELASLRETLSAISAEIATYQAQIDTARERETNRANASARERMVEAESTANANAALLEAQALDIRAVSSAAAPEILEYRFQQDVLERLAAVADRLPQVVQIGSHGGDDAVDFLQISRRMIGTGSEPLFTPEDMQAIRDRMEEIQARIKERAKELDSLSDVQEIRPEEEPLQHPAAEEENADRIEEIRQSVTDEAVRERVERLGHDGEEGAMTEMMQSVESQIQAQTGARMQDFSRIKEVVSGWSGVRQYLRGGDGGQIVPVVIPKDGRRYGWLFLLGVGVYLLGFALFSGSAVLAILAALVAVFFFGLASLWLWRGAIVEIEQGTTGVRSRYGRIEGTLPPGRHYLWRPWDRVEFVVDTATEIPYLAPVAVCPTRENVPLKSIEFFLKFRIVDPLAFVRVIGASNFDLVLSSAVQDAIRQRSRQVNTEKAYDLRGSDVGDMQDYLNRQLTQYGVRILGANIPDVQLPDQYQQHLATRERVAKELAAYEREWELTRKQRIDTLLMEIERSKKDREARLIEVNEARNRARQDVARMLEEQETEAQRVRLEIETRGRGALTEAENEATALRHLGQAHRDNQAVVRYELARRRVEIGEKLMRRAPRPVLIRGEGGEQSALSTLLLARLLPQLTQNGNTVEDASEALRDIGDGEG